MNKKIIRGLTDLFIYFKLTRYILLIFYYVKLEKLEVRLLRYLSHNDNVNNLPCQGLSRVFHLDKGKVKIEAADLSLLTKSLKLRLIDHESLRFMFASLLTDNSLLVNDIKGQDFISVIKILCEPRTIELTIKLIESYKGESEYSSAAVAHYYYYTHRYEDSIEEYSKIKSSNNFNASQVMFMLSVLDRQDEISSILDFLPRRQQVRYIKSAADRYSVLVRREEVELENAIKTLRVLKLYSYASCKNLIVSICFKMNKYSAVVHLKSSIFNENKIAHVSGLEYIYSIVELEGLEKAYSEARETIQLLSVSQSYKIIWRYSLLLSNIFDKKRLSELFSDDLKSKCKEFSYKSGDYYIYHLLFGDVENLVNSIHNRFEKGRKYFGLAKGEDKTFRFVSVKNVNYSYIMSSCFELYGSNDLILCEDRFIKVFKKNFPDNEFISISRPKQDNVLTTPEWYGYKVRNLAALCGSIKAQTLSFDHIEGIRRKGWLVGSEVQHAPIDKEKINIGISFGSALTTGFRSAYNIPYSIIELFDRSKFNLINLDFHIDNKRASELGLTQPDFDLKNDMLELGNLISSLHALVCIPNNIMDAGAAYGTLTIVYDPYGRTSYWQYRNTNEYVFGSNVFLYQNRIEGKVERDKSFVREICGRLNDEY